MGMFEPIGDDLNIAHALKTCMDDLKALANRCLEADIIDIEEYNCITENLDVWNRVHIAAAQDGGGEGDVL